MMVPFLSSMSTVSWLSFIRKRTNFILLGLRESGQAASVACVAQGPIYTLPAVLAADTRRQQCERVPRPLPNEPSRAKEGEIADVSILVFSSFLLTWSLVPRSSSEADNQMTLESMSGYHGKPRSLPCARLAAGALWL